MAASSSRDWDERPASEAQIVSVRPGRRSRSGGEMEEWRNTKGGLKEKREEKGRKRKRSVSGFRTRSRIRGTVRDEELWTGVEKRETENKKESGRRK